MKNYSRKTNQSRTRYRTPSRIRAQRAFQRFSTSYTTLSKKLTVIAFTLSSVVLASVPVMTAAFTLDKLNTVTDWSCTVFNDTTYEQSNCSGEDKQKLDQGGIRIGSSSLRTVLSQITDSLDNTDQYPIVQLSFEYKLIADSNSADASFTAQLVKSYTYETVELLATTIDHDTEWHQVKFDLHDYTAGTPTVEFIVDNDVDTRAQVSIRNVHLYVKSYATLQASVLDANNSAIDHGRIKIFDHFKKPIRQQKIARDGTITMLHIPGSKQRYTIRLAYNQRHYRFHKRLRFGSDYSYTWQLNTATKKLKVL